MTDTPLRLERASETIDLAETYSLRALYENPELLAPPVAIVPRFAYRGRLTLLSAPKKSGKSTLTGAAVAALSRGGPFLGQPTTALATLWACLDEPLSDLVRRLKAEGADPDQVLIAPAGSIARLCTTATYFGIPLLVVDTVGDLLIGEVESENDSRQVRGALAPLRAFARDQDAAVVLVHHTTKATGRARGSGAFEELCDLLLTLSVEEEDSTVRKVNAEGRVGVEDYRFRLAPDGVELADREPTVMELVEMAVYGRPKCSTRSILDGVSRNHNEVHSAIGMLSRLGRIRNIGKGKSHEWIVVEAGNTSGNTPGTGLQPALGTLGNTPGTAPRAVECSSPLRGNTQTGNVPESVAP